MLTRGCCGGAFDDFRVVTEVFGAIGETRQLGAGKNVKDYLDAARNSACATGSLS